jgi:peroxiredoxin Q/BCP
MMNRSSKALVSVALVTLVGAGSLLAQATPTPPPAQTYQPLEVGAVAPDFALPGATRYGVLKDPVRLSDYKGKTVVLAFFFKARTKG